MNQKPTSQWLSHIEQTLPAKSGQLIAHDEQGTPLVLEWLKTNIRAPELAAAKKATSGLASQVVADIEATFLKAHPEAVKDEYFLKPCAPFFEKGLDAVDWHSVKETIQTTMQQFYEMDLSLFGDEVIQKIAGDLYFYVMCKDRETSSLLGFLQFSVTPALPYGEVKVMNIVVAPEAQNHGIEKLLMSSIFALVPAAKRLFTGIRPTDIQQTALYRSWGFVDDVTTLQDPNHPINKTYWTLLEYRADRTSSLQETAQQLASF